MKRELTVINLHEARFECTYGRGCDGICCREGRPPVYPDEEMRLNASLDKFLPLLRPEARAVILKRGYLGHLGRQARQPVMRVVGGWCIFFNGGCVLHKVGAAEGDKYRYKPALCSLFPIVQDRRDRWYVRQKNFKGEKWDLFCLDPQASKLAAAESLRDEIALAQHFDEEAQALEQSP